MNTNESEQKKLLGNQESAAGKTPSGSMKGNMREAEKALKEEEEELNLHAKGIHPVDDDDYEWLKGKVERFRRYKEEGGMPKSVAKLPAYERMLAVVEEYRAQGKKYVPLAEWKKFEEVEE